VTLFSEVAVTQEPATEKSKTYTQDNTGQVAATQETATTPTGDTQEPPVVGISDQMNAEKQPLPPLEPAFTQAQPTISSLQEEIEFLKSQIQDYQEEIIRVQEAYQNEYNLHILARVASATDKSQYNEYMCSECGELYTQAGYKIVQIPMTTASSQLSPVMIETE